MFKYLIFLSLVLSLRAHSQEVVETCEADESCIMTTTVGGHQSIFKLNLIEDVEGNIEGARLNSPSSIVDVFYEGVTACYQGDIATICSIGELLAGSTNLDYAQGGHSQISEFNCYALNKVITFDFVEKSDYADEPIPSSVEIKKCLN